MINEGNVTRILGIDPGLKITGFGVIESDGRSSRYIHSGNVCARGRRGDAEMPRRLGIIFRRLTEVIDRYKPDEIAVEEVFISRNASSALKLGHARGAALSAAVQFDIPVSEYSVRSIRKTIVGNGAANKEQVQYMVLRLLALRGKLQLDEADALAVSLCHAYSSLLVKRQQIHCDGSHV